MAVPIELSNDLKEILVDLIKTDIWATRERHGRSAIHGMDDEGQFLDRKGYFTNLDVDFEKLGENRDLIKRISDYISILLPRQQSVRIIHPEAFLAKSYTRSFLDKTIQNLGLEVVDTKSINDSKSLVLIAGVHSQEMVDIWRKYDTAIEMMIVLLGVSRVHIDDDLHLSSNKYIALASRDTLEQIDPDIRHVMIPHA